KFDIALNKVLDERLSAEAQAEIYVSSFTENPDQLSQWRAYCPPSGGDAIGFAGKALAESTGPTRNRFLASCVYDLHLQERLVSTLVGDVAMLAESDRHAGLEHDRIFRESFKLLGRLLPLVAPVLKDSSFSEENEW